MKECCSEWMFGEKRFCCQTFECEMDMRRGRRDKKLMSLSFLLQHECQCVNMVLSVPLCFVIQPLAKVLQNVS